MLARGEYFLLNRMEKFLPQSLSNRLEFLRWSKRNYTMPCPHFIKQSVLKNRSLPDVTFVETGTYEGSTSKFVAAFSRQVITLEPADDLFTQAKQRLASYANITCLHGTSEALFATLLPTITGDVNFWLDGHFSGGKTFEGAQHTPIEEELQAIQENLPCWPRVVIMVDDVRCFDAHHPAHADYPPVSFLTDYAQRNNLAWFIENDIFIMTKGVA